MEYISYGWDTNTISITGKNEPMKKTDDDVLSCANCGETIYPGDKYYKRYGLPYCKLKCLPDDEYDEECYIMTAYDYAIRYYDKFIN